MRECGHSFCVTCLQEWFNTAYSNHLAKYPAYDPQQLIPATVRTQFSQGNISASTKRNLQSKVAGIFYKTRGPKFSCPTCRMRVHEPPMENLALKRIVSAIADAAQGGCPMRPPPLCWSESGWMNHLVAFSPSPNTCNEIVRCVF